MGKTILKAVLRFFEGLIGGYLIFALLFYYVFNVPVESSTLGGIGMVTGTFFFFATFWLDSHKIKKNSKDKIYDGVEQIKSQKEVPDPTGKTATPKKTPKINKGQSVQKVVGITVCPNCKMKVLPKSDGTCPNCQSKIM